MQEGLSIFLLNINKLGTMLVYPNETAKSGDIALNLL